MKRKVTRADVAKLANVSPTIVSYVLNDSNYVSEEKKKSVLAAVEELGYIPNPLARGLRTKKSSHFAFICDNIQEKFFSEVEELLFQKGYFVSLNYSRKTDDFIRMIIGRQFDGVFMASNVFTTDQLNKIAESGIPIIFYRTRNYENLNPGIVTIVPHYSSGVMQSIDYLALKGHKRIALIPPVKYQTLGIHGDDFRVRAYVKGLKKNNLPIVESLVCTRTDSPEMICDSIFTMITNENIEERPTAFIVGNDYLAAQIMQYLKKFNLKVPDDIALIGSDNTDITTIVSPTLTTVGFSNSDLARECVDGMLALVEGEKVESKFIETKLVIRESV